MKLFWKWEKHGPEGLLFLHGKAHEKDFPEITVVQYPRENVQFQL